MLQLQVKSRLPAFAEGNGLPFALQKDLKLVTGITARYALNGDWQLDVADMPGGTGLAASVDLAAGCGSGGCCTAKCMR